MDKIKVALKTGVTCGGRFYIANDPANPANLCHEFDEAVGLQIIKNGQGKKYIEPSKEELTAAEKEEAERKEALRNKDETPSPLQDKWLEEAQATLAKKLETVPDDAMAVVTKDTETKKALTANVKAYIEAQLATGSE